MTTKKEMSNFASTIMIRVLSFDRTKLGDGPCGQKEIMANGKIDPVNGKPGLFFPK